MAQNYTEKEVLNEFGSGLSLNKSSSTQRVPGHLKKCEGLEDDIVAFEGEFTKHRSESEAMTQQLQDSLEHQPKRVNSKLRERAQLLGSEKILKAPMQQCTDHSMEVEDLNYDLYRTIAKRVKHGVLQSLLKLW